jgi:hypothetical protein
MPRSRGRKNPKHPNVPSPPAPPKLPWWRRWWGATLAISTVVCLAAAVVTFLPRVTIDVGDPTDPLNAFSAPVTVTNTFPPLERVQLVFGLCKIVYRPLPGVRLQQAGRANCVAGSGVRITSTAMAGHRFGTDEKWRVLLKDFVGEQPDFQNGDITMILSFTPWPLNYLRADWLFGCERQFRFQASKENNGHWQWFPITIDQP